MSFLKGKRILVTGGAGFLGTQVCRELDEFSPAEIIVPRSADHDLREPAVVRELLRTRQPQVIVHLAAVVGGIGANRENPGRYFYENAVMAIHLMEEARLAGVEKFVSIGTICSYPKHTSVPFKEEDLWNGYPEETNAPYGLAKKMLLVQGQAYRQQYDFNAITLLPVNLYGPGDNFDPKSSHVIPALIKKCYDAVEKGHHHINVWGNGSATREFLFVRDAARAIAMATESYNESDPINIGSGQEIRIHELLTLLRELCNFRGEVHWDTSKPDGQPRRCLDTSKAQEKFCFKAETGLREGLAETIAYYEREFVYGATQPRPTHSPAEAERTGNGCQVTVRQDKPSSYEEGGGQQPKQQENPHESNSSRTPLTPEAGKASSKATRSPQSSPTSDTSHRSSRRALITGITGQDGSYLAEFLLARGYEVHGIVRRSSSINTWRIDQIYQDPHEYDQKLILHYGDVTDSNSVTAVILETEPDEIYNLAAQSHVRVSFDNPVYTVQAGAIGTMNVLEATRLLNLRRSVRYYQASSSEMFGGASGTAPLSETTPFHPRSPYACAKTFAHYQTVNYREAYDIFACCGILFNHESPRRGETFVTRKITRAATQIREGLQDKLYLGNLDARRDWGYAKDYVEAMWLMLQQDEPDDYVIATGETHSVQEFLEHCFDYVDRDWREHVEIDPRYFRPSEVDVLCGDVTKAREKLGWHPETSFNELVGIMVDADWKQAKVEQAYQSFRVNAE